MRCSSRLGAAPSSARRLRLASPAISPTSLQACCPSTVSTLCFRHRNRVGRVFPGPIAGAGLPSLILASAAGGDGVRRPPEHSRATLTRRLRQPAIAENAPAGCGRWSCAALMVPPHLRAPRFHDRPVAPSARPPVLFRLKTSTRWPLSTNTRRFGEAIACAVRTSTISRACHGAN
jgi:hypothetical protein